MRLARLLVIFGLLLAPAWSGAVVFTNLGPSDTFLNTGYDIFNTSVTCGPCNVFVAADFVPSLTGALDSIRLPLDVIFGTPTGNLLISLRPPGADPTGAALESWVLAPGDVAAFPGVGIEVLQSVLNPVLTTGNAYWLRVDTTTTLQGPFIWFVNSTGDSGYLFSNDTGTTWKVPDPPAITPAFEVNVQTGAVPEPSTWALVMAGGFGLFLRRRRSR